MTRFFLNDQILNKKDTYLLWVVEESSRSQGAHGGGTRYRAGCIVTGRILQLLLQRVFTLTVFFWGRIAVRQRAQNKKNNSDFETLAL